MENQTRNIETEEKDESTIQEIILIYTRSNRSYIKRKFYKIIVSKTSIKI